MKSLSNALMLVKLESNGGKVELRRHLQAREREKNKNKMIVYNGE